jgi:hypothetical protein
MGKHTLYHPVSLNVIRGAAEYHGFKFGKISQLASNYDTATARYRTYLYSFHGTLRDRGLDDIRKDLQSAFMPEVTITGIWQRKTGVIAVEFTCQLDQSVPFDYDIDDRKIPQPSPLPPDGYTAGELDRDNPLSWLK